MSTEWKSRPDERKIEAAVPALINNILPVNGDVWEAARQRLRLLRGGRPVFVVAVTYLPSGARRNRVFMTADAAHKHATDLLERGHRVSVQLATLTPTETLLGGDGDE